MAFHSNSLDHDPCLPRVEVKKFDGSDPIGWVTQMEHYPFMELLMIWQNFIMVSFIWIMKPRNGGSGVEIHNKGMFLGQGLLQIFMNTFTLKPTI
jgi:hypothetical protein